MSDFGILFLHHTIDRATKANLASIKAHNRSALVVTMSAGKMLSGGYALENTPEVQMLHSVNPQRSSDWLVCSWFLQRRERCDKWWIVEWDTFCAVSVKDYYRPVWNFPFVASSVRLPHREPEWVWFGHVQNLPGKFQSSAVGAVPFLYLVSDHALTKVCEALLQHPFTVGNGELRFATVANWCGIPPCGFSPPHDRIGWINRASVDGRKMIFHPLKYPSP